jgi:F-type H+-transporting ATPase subunit gamma
MAGGQERVLRRRIKSVESTKKITRAMELIAATRVVKAQERANASRPYSELITSVIFDLVKAGASLDHPLLQDRTEGKAAFVVVAGDRGLCGAYNSTVIRLAERELQARQKSGDDYSLILVGNKAQSYFKFRNYRIDEHFGGFTDQPSYEDARAVGAAVRRRFEAGEFKTLDLVYTRFVTAGTQRPVVRRFLPLDVVEDETGDGEAGPHADLEYEPSPTTILDTLLPRYVEARVFSALLDASASEHANRQRAMKSATDNAEELKTTLSRIMNRARQDAITTEIMEIVGGAEALSQDRGTSEDLMLDHLFPEHLFPLREQIDAPHPPRDPRESHFES